MLLMLYSPGMISTVKCRSSPLARKSRMASRASSIDIPSGETVKSAVSPQGDQQADDLVARFKAITDPKEQTTFWRNLTPQQQAQILAATAS